MSPQLQRIVGWTLSGLIAAFLLFSASGKLFPLMPADKKEEMLKTIGWQEESLKVIGVVEVVVVVLYLIPRSGFLGAILLTGYLGGAMATHARIGGDTNWIMPLVMGFLSWVALALRQPVLWRLAVGANPSPPPAA